MKRIAPYSLLAIFVCTALSVRSQSITIHKKNATLSQVMGLIEKKSAYTFWYRGDIPPKAKKTDIDVKDATISEVLKICAKEQPFTFHITGPIIVLKPDTGVYIRTGITNPNALAGPKGKTVSDGYQQYDQKLSTSSISKVDNNQSGQLSITNMLSNAGITGLQIQSNSRGTSMQIQGKNSLTAGTEPLILLDGIPYQGDVNQINPSTVESINVLKDASTTSMYGSRGANGVIVITSKRAAAPAINPLESLISEREGTDYYEGAHVYAIFKHIAKKYDAEVFYKTSVPPGFYYGKMPSGFTLDQITDVLASAGIAFKREGRMIIID